MAPNLCGPLDTRRQQNFTPETDEGALGKPEQRLGLNPDRFTTVAPCVKAPH